MMYEDTTVIIPTLNEGKNIVKLLKLIKKLYPKIFIIVSDDGSKDGTQELAKKNGAYVLDRGKLSIHGLTISVLDGVHESRTKYFVVIDGDLQHPPEKIRDIINGLRKGYDVVIGVRNRVASEWPWHRKLMSKIAGVLGNFRLVLGGRDICDDVLSGFFGARTDLFKKVPYGKFEARGYKVLFDGLKALPRNIKVSGVPYTFGVRRGGKSKISKRHVILYFKSLFK